MLSQRGGLLPEALIALGLGSLLTAAALAMLSSTLAFSRDGIVLARLNQELRQALRAIELDAQRAGYWSAAEAAALASMRADLRLSGSGGAITAVAVATGTDTPIAVFEGALGAGVIEGGSLVVGVATADGLPAVQRYTIQRRIDASRLQLGLPAAAGPLASRVAAAAWTLANPFAGLVSAEHCVALSYDEDDNGLRGAQEHYGYRHDADEAALEGSHNAAGCSGGDWQNLSDERSVRLTGFEVAATVQLVDPTGTWALQRHRLALLARAQPLRAEDLDREYRAWPSPRNDSAF